MNAILVEEEQPTVKIPVHLMAVLIAGMGIGLQEEDPHEEIEFNSEEFTFFDKLVLRGIEHHGNEAFRDFAKNELNNFWQEFIPNDDHISDPFKD